MLARWNGVYPTRLYASMSAPASSRICAQIVFPISAHLCRAVQPSTDFCLCEMPDTNKSYKRYESFYMTAMCTTES